MRILVVDDHRSILLSYTVILQDEGHEVMAAASFDDAVAALSKHKFDLLLCDLGLDQGRNGWEVIEYARQRYPGNPAVLITGYSGPDIEAAAAQCGVPVLYKPVDTAALINAVNSSISEGNAAAS